MLIVNVKLITCCSYYLWQCSYCLLDWRTVTDS